MTLRQPTILCLTDTGTTHTANPHGTAPVQPTSELTAIPKRRFTGQIQTWHSLIEATKQQTRVVLQPFYGAKGALFFCANGIGVRARAVFRLIGALQPRATWPAKKAPSHNPLQAEMGQG